MWEKFIGRTILSIETREVCFYADNVQTLVRFTFTDGIKLTFQTDCGDLEDCWGNLQECMSFDDLKAIDAKEWYGPIKKVK